MRIDGITVWDGQSDIGPSTLTWDTDIHSVAACSEDHFPELCVIPGLIDTHVHLVSDASPQPADFSTWPLTTTREEQVLHGVAHAQRALRHGVTTIRDLAADEAQVAIRRAFDAGIVGGPRVLAHGVVGMTGGHSDLFVPPAVKERNRLADGPDACRQLVRTWARAGMDGIKVPVSGGVLSMVGKTSWRNYTRDEVQAIVDEAHALGLPLAAHAHSVEGIQVALDEGFDSIEHATQMTAEQAELASARQVPVAPTLLINEAIAKGTVPVRAESQEKAAALVEARDALFRQAAAVGVRFVLGTDANGFHVQLGDEMTEVQRMGEVFGWSPSRCLAAATSDAAAAMGLGDSVGRIAPGFGADLVVLRGRPWKRLADLRPDNVVAVVCRGELVRGTLPGSRGTAAALTSHP
jgi:imidazolonepropionase-like amidohydrolase